VVADTEVVEAAVTEAEVMEAAAEATTTAQFIRSSQKVMEILGTAAAVAVMEAATEVDTEADTVEAAEVDMERVNNRV
jgi:uracil phosphoribosyltransferase